MHWAAHYLLEWHQIWQCFGLRQHWCFGNSNDSLWFTSAFFVHSYQPSSSQQHFLPTSFRPGVMWPHHPGHKQIGLGTGISVNNYGLHWISLRTLQGHSRASAPGHYIFSLENKFLWKQKPGSRASRIDTSHDLECRRTAEKAAGGGREAAAWHKAQQ